MVPVSFPVTCGMQKVKHVTTIVYENNQADVAMINENQPTPSQQGCDKLARCRRRVNLLSRSLRVMVNIVEESLVGDGELRRDSASSTLNTLLGRGMESLVRLRVARTLDQRSPDTVNGKRGLRASRRQVRREEVIVSLFARVRVLEVALRTNPILTRSASCKSACSHNAPRLSMESMALRIPAS
jgi:hypothetical protein